MKAWVVAVDMGYGHQRAAYPFHDIAYERILTANSDKIIVPAEQRRWQRSEMLYEWLSRFKTFPIIGSWLWKQYDKLQRILPLYPYRDLSFPTLSVLYLRWLIKRGFCRSVIDYVKKQPEYPLLTTFFVTGVAADYHGIHPIFCIVTDTDINRIWVPKDPKTSNIIYFAPCKQTVTRLTEYGVPKKNIILTGFPLPKELVGGRSLRIAKKNFANRMVNLDPQKDFIKTSSQISGKGFKGQRTHPLTLTYVVGGAGAQIEIGTKILKSLKEFILQGVIRVNLVAGTRIEVKNDFDDAITGLGLGREAGKGVRVVFELSKLDYFRQFSKTLETTDILWTKTSELSFYTALGIPIICAPPIGSHEYFNRKWLQQMGSGLSQEDPEYTHEWLFDWLERGIFAKAAFDGYTLAPKLGTYNIESYISRTTS